MTRSRAALLVAWGLLAVASAIQFVRSGDGPGPGAPPEASTGSAESAATPASTGSAESAAASADHLSSGRSNGESGPSGEDTAAGITIDDPAGWDRAGPGLAPTSIVATVTGEGGGVASRDAPGGGEVVHWFPNPTQFGGRRTFLVVDDTSSEDYVKVSLPVMPNGQEGWIARSAIELSTIDHRALVDLSDRSVTVWQGDDLIASTAAVTGRAATPTPLGSFYVRDIIAQPDPGGSYGPWILALSGFSEVLDSFDGGLPALALHGTDRPEQIGTARSSGCVRVPNEIISLLAATVPLGTPVTVTS